MRNEKNKGFTLIELLVVVAIIGILAAVGVVAYSGYTAGAKKQAAKSNQAAVAKYVAAELQKCNLGESKAMSDELDCSAKTPKNVAEAAAKALADFKNPYSTSNAAVTHTPTTTNNDSDVGYTRVIQGTGKVTVSTCFATSCGTSSNVTSNDIKIE